MLQAYFAHPLFLWALAGLPLLVIPAVWAACRRRRTLAQLGSQHALAALLTASPRGRRWRRLATYAGLFLLIVGAAGPQWGRAWYQEPEPGRDVVVLVDCSRSMRAGTPSRLALAGPPPWIWPMRAAESGRLSHRPGHLRRQSAAGGALDGRLCPFPSRTGRRRDLSGRPGRPADGGDTSGTRLGRGLEAAVQAHDERFPGARDIVLLSDGDDPVEDAEWLTGTARASSAGIPVDVVGVGDPEEAMTIPGPDGQPLQDKEGPVMSRLQEAPLREIARRTNGEYVAGHTNVVPLGRLYLNHVAHLPTRLGDADALPIFHQRQTWFLVPAFALLAMTLVIPDGSRRNRPKEDRS